MRHSEQAPYGRLGGQNRQESRTMSETLTSEPLKGPAVADAERTAATFARVREGIGRTIFGQREVIDQSLTTLRGR